MTGLIPVLRPMLTVAEWFMHLIVTQAYAGSNPVGHPINVLYILIYYKMRLQSETSSFNQTAPVITVTIMDKKIKKENKNLKFLLAVETVLLLVCAAVHVYSYFVG